MMAMRFRSMGLVAAVGAAALACYMVSLRVAAERFALARIEGKVLSARLDIRRLQTEMGTRGRLVQLERWNSDVLALSAPKAAQYVNSDVQLASYAKPTAGLPNVIEVRAIAPVPALAPVQTVAYAPPPRALSVSSAPPAARVQTVAFTPAPSRASARLAPQPLLHEAAYVRPSSTRLGAQKMALLDDGVLGEIGKAASAEAADSHARR